MRRGEGGIGREVGRREKRGRVGGRNEEEWEGEKEGEGPGVLFIEVYTYLDWPLHSPQ